MSSYRFEDGEPWGDDRHALEGADEVDPRFGGDGWAESSFRTPNLQWDGTHRGYSPYPTRNDSHNGVYHSIHPNTPYGSSAVHLNQSHSVWLNHDNYQNPYAAGYGASTPLKSSHPDHPVSGLHVGYRYPVAIPTSYGRVSAWYPNPAYYDGGGYYSGDDESYIATNSGLSSASSIASQGYHSGDENRLLPSSTPSVISSGYEIYLSPNSSQYSQSDDRSMYATNVHMESPYVGSASDYDDKVEEYEREFDAIDSDGDGGDGYASTRSNYSNGSGRNQSDYGYSDSGDSDGWFSDWALSDGYLSDGDLSEGGYTEGGYSDGGYSY